MSVRFVTRTVHAYLDYPVALALMVLPFVLGLGQSNPMALWLSVVTGVAALVLTVLTNHHLGVWRVLPYKFHLAVDLLVGVTFLAAPSLFGFSRRFASLARDLVRARRRLGNETDWHGKSLIWAMRWTKSWHGMRPQPRAAAAVTMIFAPMSKRKSLWQAAFRPCVCLTAPPANAGRSGFLMKTGRGNSPGFRAV